MNKIEIFGFLLSAIVAGFFSGFVVGSYKGAEMHALGKMECTTYVVLGKEKIDCEKVSTNETK